MDVQGSPFDAGEEDAPTGSEALVWTRPLSREAAGRKLGEWQAGELRLARSFAECKDLGRAELEDIYQETVIVLLARPHHDEQHLRNALRWGIKRRALQSHRNERRRGEILDQRGGELEAAAERREQERTPELALVLARGPARRQRVPDRALRARAAGVLARGGGHALPGDRAGARDPRERRP